MTDLKANRESLQKMVAESKAAQKKQLENEHFSDIGTPIPSRKQLDKLYDLAWEHGHSAGLHEVAYYYADFAGLLK